MEKFRSKERLTEQELEKIIYFSYMFSQGSISLQKAIILQLNGIIGKQEGLDVSAAYDRFAKKLQYTKDDGFSLGRAQIHTNEALDDPHGHVRDVKALAGGERAGAEGLQDIVDGIWERDYQYLCTEDGRPNRDKDNFKEGTLQDPYFSFGVAYLEKGHDTPNDVFNLLLQKLRQETVSPQHESTRMDVIEKYNKTHPDSSISTNPHEES